jgi:hypothetical protein
VAENKFDKIDLNFVTYNPQVVRDDVFLLIGTWQQHRMVVIRSSSAVVVGSQNRTANGSTRSSRP